MTTTDEPRPAQRRRRPALGVRILATGLSTAAAMAIVSALVLAEAPATATPAASLTEGAGPSPAVAPAAPSPARPTIVYVVIRRNPQAGTTGRGTRPGRSRPSPQTGPRRRPCPPPLLSPARLR